VNAVYLTHTDPARNMARFYVMSLQVTLFAECSLIREWGRIGRGGQVKATVFSTTEAAQAALSRIEKAKRKGGYESMNIG
jgi:predicted DNA-binding WGR domain protein